jgi:hypothetical protein
MVPAPRVLLIRGHPWSRRHRTRLAEGPPPSARLHFRDCVRQLVTGFQVTVGHRGRYAYAPGGCSGRPWPGPGDAKGEARCVKVVESRGWVSLVSGAAASLRSRLAGDGERPPPSPGVGQCGPPGAGTGGWRALPLALAARLSAGVNRLRLPAQAWASFTARTPRLAGGRVGEGACHDRGYASRHQGLLAAPRRGHRGRGRGGAGRS